MASICSTVSLANLVERAGVEPPHLRCEVPIAGAGAAAAEEAAIEVVGRARGIAARGPRRARCRGIVRSADRADETILEIAGDERECAER